MWKMGYNEGCDLPNMSDPFNGRKLRPLMPRTTPSSNHNISTTTHNPCLVRLYGNDFFALNQNLATNNIYAVDQATREYNTTLQPVAVSSRWNPTPEQLRALEDLYQRGTRTPSADQIQHITSQLRRFGKIEGKNVFYWFQNHKARERQKRRRQMEPDNAPDGCDSDDQRHHQHDHHRENNVVAVFERKDSGTNRKIYDGHQIKNRAYPTSCSRALEEIITIQKAEETKLAGLAVSEFNGEEFQDTNRRSTERNATWQTIPSPSSHHHHLNKGNPTTTTPPPSPCTTTTTPTLKNQINISPITTFIGTLDQTFIKSTDRDNINNMFITSCKDIGHGLIFDHQDLNFHGESYETLELFPLRSSLHDDGGCRGDRLQIDDDKNVTEILPVSSDTMVENFSTPYRFFEFLPLKN